MATPKKASTKTIKKATKMVVAAEQLTLVDALPVATEPPAAAAPEPALRATRAAAPQVPETQTFVTVDDKPRRILRSLSCQQRRVGVA